MLSGFPPARFKCWTVLHSFICLLFGALLFSAAGTGSRDAYAALLCPYSVAAFAALFTLQGRGSITLPNFVSLLRLAGAGYGLLSIAFPVPRGWCLFAVLAASALSDLADGLLARRMGPTIFGGKLDMELDAFSTYALSVMGLALFDTGRWILFTGLMRYCYVFVLLALPPAGGKPAAQRPAAETPEAGRPPWLIHTAKTICAVAVTALVLITAPILPGGVKRALAAFALGILGVSFALDFAMRVFNKSD